MCAYRYRLAAMAFLGFFNCMAIRFNFNIALVAMVNYTSADAGLNNTSDECPDWTNGTNTSSIATQVELYSTYLFNHHSCTYSSFHLHILSLDKSFCCALHRYALLFLYEFTNLLTAQSFSPSLFPNLQIHVFICMFNHSLIKTYECTYFFTCSFITFLNLLCHSSFKN